MIVFGLQSCPSRGTWIEMLVKRDVQLYLKRRAPRGARGLKCLCLAVLVSAAMVVPLAGHVD